MLTTLLPPHTHTLPRPSCAHASSPATLSLRNLHSSMRSKRKIREQQPQVHSGYAKRIAFPLYVGYFFLSHKGRNSIQSLHSSW